MPSGLRRSGPAARPVRAGHERARAPAGRAGMSAVVPDPAATPPQTARVVNIANGLTLLRLLLVPVFGYALVQEDGQDTAWRVAACVIFAVASITDRLDGDLARRR